MEDILDYGKTEDNKYIRYFHLSVLTFIFIPLGNIIIPLILWLTKRDKIIGLNEQGADLLNFQILWTLLFSGLMVADEIFIINMGGYIGSSTKSEIECAKNTGKSIKYLEPDNRKTNRYWHLWLHQN